MVTNEFRVLAPTGAVGYTPFDETAFQGGLAANPDFIGADAGSPDSGPIYVATTKHYGTREASKRDIRRMILAGIQTGTQVAVGGANGFGSNQDVETTLDLVQEIVREERITLDVAVVWADVDKDYLLGRLQSEEIEPLGAPAPLTADDVRRSQVIAHQMGPEPMMRALATGAQLVIAGRMCDDAIFAAPMMAAGFDRGLALHLGKIVECGASCASPTPAGENAILGTIRDDHFIVTGTTPEMFVTPDSVAKHGLYERDHPFLTPGPGGVNDVSRSRYEQLDPHSVKVSGSTWLPGPYKVRLEGAAFVGYRTRGIVGIRNESLIADIDDFLERARHELVKVYRDIYDPRSYKVFFHEIGRAHV